MMKVGDQWLPAFLNSINGTPTYTYMNDQGQWADASGNTYNVEHPLDEVTVKYDPKTNGQINKAAPDNNGDFDLSNYNIYKSLIPTIIGGAYYTN